MLLSFQCAGHNWNPTSKTSNKVAAIDCLHYNQILLYCFNFHRNGFVDFNMAKFSEYTRSYARLLISLRLAKGSPKKKKT